MSTPQAGTQSARRTSEDARWLELVRHLDDLVTRGDLGALALLRRGLGSPLDATPEIFAQVLPYLSQPAGMHPRRREREEDAALLVASLFALWYQGKSGLRRAPGVSLGRAFRQLANDSDSTSIEQRFTALLKSSRERLPDHLRHAISLLRAKDIALDWGRLAADLARWDETDQRARHPVRRGWARDYWERAYAPGNETGGASGEGESGNNEDIEDED